MSINRWTRTTARNQYGWELCRDSAPRNRHSNEGVGEAEMGVSYFYKITIFLFFTLNSLSIVALLGKVTLLFIFLDLRKRKFCTATVLGKGLLMKSSVSSLI